MSSEEDESMSEMEEQENNQKKKQTKHEKNDGGVLDYIMSLESVPPKLPPHLDLLRTRVLCNNDAPQHVPPRSLSIFRFLMVHFFF